MPKLDDYKKILVCPHCRGPLTFNPEGTSLDCRSCPEIYAIENGIPVLLPGRSRQKFREQLGTSRPVSGLQKRVSALLAALRAPEPYRLSRQKKRVASFLSGIAAGELVLDLGSGGRRLKENIINADITAGGPVDMVADGHQLPFADNSLGAVICISVLEHTWDPAQVVREISRVLRPGGQVYLEIPFLYPYHPATGTVMDYHRFTDEGIALLTPAFRKIELGTSAGPGTGLVLFLEHYLAELLNFWHRRSWPREIIRIVTRWIFWPLVWLDPLLSRSTAVASVFYYRGEKPRSADKP